MSKISTILAVIAIILSGICAYFVFNQGSEIAYVDINKLMDGYKRTEKVRADFEKKAKTLNANVDSLISDWQNELKIYEKERSSMSKKELELKQELLGNKQQQIGNYQEAIQKQIQEEDQKATQTVINDINDFVKEYGKNKGYYMILGASGTGNIMYANDPADLTEEVLEGLNKDFTAQ